MARLIMPRPVPVLTGQIVTLRPIDAARDAADYYRISLDAEMHEWTGNQVLPSVEAACHELERFAAMDDITMWAIVDNATGAMAGRFFVTLQEREGSLVAGEGNRVARRFWRKGHNREARRLVFTYVFGVLGADAVETECWTENVNSRKSIEAHGFAFVSEEIAYNPKYAKEMGKTKFYMTRQRWLDLYGQSGESGC